ncbi:MAG TPA: hypothetical protein VHO24_09105 [Opitutaceae bacterium]|nr:hypothetical protein [Opitutaceae bacterium]
MKPRTKAVWQILACVAVPAAVLLLPLLIGIWLPDVFIDRTYVLAEAASSDGTQFRVEQFWNHTDFYTTNLQVIYPEGAVTTHPLDFDDDKSWSVPLVIDEKRRTVTIGIGENWFVEKAWDNRTPSYTEPYRKPR